MKKVYKTKSNNIYKQLREQANLSQEEVAHLLNMKRGAVSTWECGKSIPDQALLPKIAELYGTSVDHLLTGKEAEIKPPKKFKIPVLGSIPAGIPIEAIENIIDWEEITPEMASLGELFGLRVKGDSMLPRIFDGDIVIVKQQDYADNGDTVVVYVNGYEATLKKIKIDDTGMYLIPNNPAYAAKFYSKTEVQNLPVRIYGKVIELRGKI